jgi:hypothetical protein
MDWKIVGVEDVFEGVLSLQEFESRKKKRLFESFHLPCFFVEADKQSLVCDFDCVEGDPTRWLFLHDEE